MRRAAVSLNDIAKHLGISQMTVSRVVNRSGSVSAETAARVMAAVEELGYRRDEFASINARKRSPGMCGMRVVVDWIAEAPETPSAFSFYTQVVVQVLAGLEALGCRTTLTDLTRQGERRTADLTGADAVVFCAPVGAAVTGLVDRLARGAQRIALFQRMAGACAVNPDDDQGGCLAAERLHALGHRHVAVFATPDQASHVARRTAFVRRLAELDPLARVEDIAYRVEADGVTADLPAMHAPLAARWSSPAPLPTAAFCPGGWATFALYRFLRARGLDIPSHLGVIGYDALPFYDALDTPLTHVGFDLARVCGEAVAATAAALTGGAEPPARSIPVALDERGSLLPVREMRHALPSAG